MFDFGSPTGLNHADRTKDQMHPEDMRNMFIFFILAAFFYFTYDAFILKPQARALKARAEIQAQIEKTHGPDAIKNLTAKIKALPRNEALTNALQRIAFDNGEIYGSINLKGGRIDDLSLHKYFKTLEDKENIHLFSPDKTQHPRTVYYGWAAQDKNIALPDQNTRWSVRGNQKLSKNSPVTLVWDNGQGLTFSQRLELDEHYMFTVTQGVENHTGKKVTLHPYGILAQRGLPEKYQWMWISHEGPVAFIGDELIQPYYDTIRDQKAKKQNYVGDTGWIGITEKYWLTALVPPQNEHVEYHYAYDGTKDDKSNTGLYQADFRAAPVTLQPGGRNETQSRFFAGAKKVLLLQDYETKQGIRNIDLAVDFGWFWFFTYPFFYALHYIGLWTGNMGIAIILLTLMIRGLAFPLTNVSYRSFAKMKKVAPQVTALRKKYGDDKQELQKELIEMYTREGVNPMAGCLPILLQIPIFFALYKVFFITIEMRHAPFFGWIEDLAAPDPTSLFNLFGLVPWDPPVFLTIGVWPCMMVLAMIVQKKLNPPPQDGLQRDMANYMPFIFGFIMSRFAAGLVIYWTFSAAIGIVQQIIIMRSLKVPIYLFGEKEEEEIPTGSPDLHPLMEMAQDEAEKALFGEEEEKEEAATKTITPPRPKKSKKAGKKKK